MSSHHNNINAAEALEQQSSKQSIKRLDILNTIKPIINDDNVDDDDAQRKSLVKPTWHNVSPGQIPLKILNKINDIPSDTDDDDKGDNADGDGRDSDNCGNDNSDAQCQIGMTLCQKRRSSLHDHHYHHHCRINNGHLALSGADRDYVKYNCSLRRCSHLGQLTRKGSLVVYRDALKQNASMAGSDGKTGTTIRSRRASYGDVCNRRCSFLHMKKPYRTNSLPCRTTGCKLAHMLQQKCAIHSRQNECDLMAKVILLGDSGVGKTSLLIMCRDGIYMPCYYVTTVGIDFMNKVVIIDGTRVKLQIWDTAGQERFRSVTHAYYRDAHALLLMYDVTNKVTYDNIRAWLCEIRDCAQEDVVIVLIGNKADCSNNDRQVKRDDGERLAREHNVPFMETSAKSGQNVELAFQTVARQLKNRGYEQSDDGKFNIHEFVRDNTKAKTMCAQCNL